MLSDTAFPAASFTPTVTSPACDGVSFACRVLANSSTGASDATHRLVRLPNRLVHSFCPSFKVRNSFGVPFRSFQ